MQLPSLLLLAAVLPLLRVDSASKLPSNIELCKRSDPKFKECLLRVVPPAFSAIRGGIPSLGLPPTDPLRGVKVDIKQGDGPISINMKLTNTIIFGLGTMFLKAVHEDLNNYSLVLEGGFPNIFIDSDYVLTGRIMVLPATGNGHCRMNLTNFIGTITIKGKGVQKNNRTHLDLTEFYLTSFGLDGSYIQLDNLFNGDEILGKTLTTVMNDNWREIFRIIEPSLLATVGAVFKNYTKTLFDKVPFNDIFID